MNYVGKPLAYILATPEKPDDAGNPLRIAFGNEASDRDIEEFQRRFDCTVWDGFGSTENAVIITREEGTPKGSLGKGFPGVAIYNAETVTECPRARFDADGALINAEEAIGELVNTEGQGSSPGTTTPKTRPPNACDTACTGRATWRTAMPTAGSTWRDAAVTGCASTVRTWPRPRSNAFSFGCPRSTGWPSTRCPTRMSATRSWRRSCSTTAPPSRQTVLSPSSQRSRTSPPRHGRDMSASRPTCRRPPPTRCSNATSRRKARPPVTASCGSANRAVPATRAPAPH